MQIEIFDTTLRDGAQDPRISFSVENKLAIARKLDNFGVHYIEGGWPGSNPKDTEFFLKMRSMGLKSAKLVAFGMTCKSSLSPEKDEQLLNLLRAETPIVAIVGKTSRLQIERTLNVSIDDNLRIIENTCRFLVNSGREVFFDAEHFFDGFLFDAPYSLACIKAALAGGVSQIVLCDTNGGTLPFQVSEAISYVKTVAPVIKIGMHAHNDAELAVANSLVAVIAGVSHIQGTINGYGERCGNTNLCSFIPTAKIKMGVECISNDSIERLSSLAKYVAEIANLPIPQKQPYVGPYAFRHKAGLHASAISRDSGAYNHIDPALVGNVSSVVVSELSGRTNILIKAEEFGIKLSAEQIKKVLAEVEILENKGFQFEGADGSLKLIMLRQAGNYIQPFEVIERRVSSQRFGKNDPVDSAVVKLRIKNGKDEIAHNVADGDGPINALDNALRKALLLHFPYLEKTKLVDYKVRVLDGEKGTAKAVRILIDFSDGLEDWTTVGCSTDSIEAGLQALLDGFEYAILRTL